MIDVRRLRRGLFGAAAAGVLLAGCSGSGVSPSTGTGAATASQQGDVQVVRVTGTPQLTFSPATIHAHTGRIRVEFSVPSGSPPHTFTIRALGVDTGTVQDGATKDATFTVDRAGSYQFVCTIHAGMTGTLRVSG